MISEEFKLKVFNIHSLADFNALALEIFHYQYKNNTVYRTFVDGVCHNIEDVRHYMEIPCLPIELYKTHKIASVEGIPELIFKSSGTTGQTRSINPVYSEETYRNSIIDSFTRFYGDPSGYMICALTPDFNTQKESSLAYMLDYLIKCSGNPNSGFYLGKEKELIEVIREDKGKKIIIGITYALLEFANKYATPLNNTIIIETGGMKGKMREMIRAEVHQILSDKFSSPVHSEYSMAELMSQAYSTNGECFSTPPWMKILIREANDPLSLAKFGDTGGINIIDLANFNTCSFIATMDLGKLRPDDTFEVLGRFDFSEARGCNLLSFEF